MTDPVVTLDGQVFESSLIEEWFRIRIRQDHRRAITDYMFGSEVQATDQAGQILEAFNHHNQSDCSTDGALLAASQQQCGQHRSIAASQQQCALLAASQHRTIAADSALLAAREICACSRHEP